MSEEKKLTCTTCSGDLILDKERNLYKCPFCGVAYGYALFDGTALEKAEKSLSIGEFNDADLYFSFALSTDPKNIRAHRGRVFCAGKWKRTTDLKTGKGELTGVRADAVRKRCDEAMKKLSEEDGEYFQVIKEFVDVSEKYHNVKVKVRPIRERQKKLSEHSRDIDSRVSAMEGSYEKVRSRNRSLTDFLLDRPGSTPVPNALQDAWDVSDIMHGAMSDTQKEAMDYNRQINKYDFERKDLYQRIVGLERKMFPSD